MWNHETIWSAIDGLAARHGLSASALARKAGLDPTAFNRSKRIGSDGRPRWPSTESIHKILTATGGSLEDFVGLVRRPAGGLRPVREPRVAGRTMPLLGFAQAGAGGFFDDGGYPAGEGWDEVAVPGFGDDESYALEVSGDSMLPLYRDGDTIIVSPTAQIRRNDRVVVRTREGEAMAKILKRRTATDVELASLNPEHSDRTIPLADLVLLARIVWASQ
jgi:phage repressor protein C with HTH and peptisase S24 domain